MISKPDPRQSPYWRPREDLSYSRFNLSEPGKQNFALSMEALNHYNEFFDRFVTTATEVVTAENLLILSGKQTYITKFTSNRDIVDHIMKHKATGYAEQRYPEMARECIEMLIRAQYYMREWHRCDLISMKGPLRGLYDTRYKSFLELHDRLRSLAQELYYSRNPGTRPTDTTSQSAPVPSATTTGTGSLGSSQERKEVTDSPPNSPRAEKRKEAEEDQQPRLIRAPKLWSRKRVLSDCPPTQPDDGL